MTPSGLPPYVAPGRHRHHCTTCEYAWSSHTMRDRCEHCNQEVGVAAYDELFRPVVSRAPKPVDGLMRWGGATG